MKIVLFIFLLLLLIYSIFQKITFNKWLEEGRNYILSVSKPSNQTPSKKYPTLLQKYLDKVLSNNHKDLSYVSFTQKGLFRMKPDANMEKFTAKQYVSLVEPMFSWKASIYVNKLPVTVCDRLIKSVGYLQARIFGIFKVADDSGPELLQGELLRYLAELPWYPVAIKNLPQISWTEVGDRKLLAELNISGATAKVEYEFNEDGLIKAISVPDRKRKVDNGYVSTPWLGKFSNYKIYDGIMIPTFGEVSWLLPDGEFIYFQGEIEKYNE